MVIERVETKIVETPFQGKFRTTYGDMTTCQPHLIVRIHTSSGETGLGEASPLPFVTGETVRSMKDLVDHELAPAIVGRDIFSVLDIHDTMNLILGHASGAKSAIDMALWDAQGRTLNVPTYKLWGGRERAAIPVVFALGHDDPLNVAELAKAHSERGFQTIKIKIGSDPERDIETVRQVRQAVAPSVHIRVDANQGYSVKTAVQVSQKISDYSVEYIEQPVHYRDLDGLAYVRSVSPIPVMADESIYSPQDAIELVKRHAADLFGIKLIKAGGLYPAMQIIQIAASAGIDCVVISPWDTWLATRAGAHLTTLLPDRYAHELVGPCYLTKDPFGSDEVHGSIHLTRDQSGFGAADVFERL